MKKEIKQKIELIKNGQVPQGYKKTKVGIIPIEWKIKMLGELVEIYDGTHQTPTYTKEGIKFVSVEDIKYIDKSDKFISELDYEKNFKVKPKFNDIFMTRIGDIGTPFIIKSHNKYAFYVSLSLIRCNENFDSDFLNYSIQGYSFQKELYSKTIHVAFPKKINLGDIGHCLISLIYLKEQQKIADILKTQDKIIELKKKLIEEKEKQKKYLMQNLLTGKIRLKGFKDKWENIKVGDVFDVTRGNVLPSNKLKQIKDNEFCYPVYSSQTKNKGLLGYYREYLYENSITWTTDGVNAGNVNFRKDKFYCTNVCGVLLSNKLNTNVCIAEILNRVTKKYVSYVGNPKLMNNVMERINIKIPPLQEQNAIAEILSKADEEIELLKKDLEQEEQKKKALMQLLLTGIVRV